MFCLKKGGPAMALQRSEVIDLMNTRYYHCITRCVRREFLLGNIEKELKRKEIMEKRIFKLKDCFAINVLAYSIMDNHYHIALHIDVDFVENLSDREILERWCSVFKGHECVQKFLKGESLFFYEEKIVQYYVNEYRMRLTDISWFKGHFWEHRFISVPIKGREMLTSTMAYIDLNPLRAAVVSKPEDSHFTSLKRRVESLRLSKMGINLKEALDKKIQNTKDEFKKDILQHIEIGVEDLENVDVLKAFGFESFKGYLIGLEPLEDEYGQILRNHIDLSTEQYLKFVDMMWREKREDKRGFIAINEPCILSRIYSFKENILA